MKHGHPLRMGRRFTATEREQVLALLEVATDPKGYATIAVPTSVFLKLAHVPDERATKKAWRERRIAAGLCVGCGEPAPGECYCAECKRVRRLKLVTKRG